MFDERQLLETRIGRFDQVRILTSKNVTYLSAPPGTDVSPKGLWSVTAIISNNELLLAKQSVLIRIPATDVLLVAGYNVEKVTKNLGRLSRGEKGQRQKERDSEKSRAIDSIDRQGVRDGDDHEGSRENS